jgi:transcription termination factor NusB
MKIKVSKAIDILKDLDKDSEILLWFRTKEDMDCAESNWKKVLDDSEALEDTIDEYVNGWIEEAEND